MLHTQVNLSASTVINHNWRTKVIMVKASRPVGWNHRNPGLIQPPIRLGIRPIAEAGVKPQHNDS